MDQNICEKIFSRHSHKKVYAGDYVLADLDFAMAHDTTCAWAIDPFYKIAKKVWDAKKILIFFDHAWPCPNTQAATLQQKIRQFAQKQNIAINTAGVCHQVMVEKFIRPGNLVLGADSHTPTSGALGALAIGAGSTDVAIAMATGKGWFKVPSSIKINFVGKLPANVYAKDVILKIAKDLGVQSAVYKCIEFGGPCLNNFSVSDRMTLCNMSAELGAKAAICSPQIKTLQSDKNCRYDKIIEYDLAELKPQIACPHEVNNVCDVSDLSTKKIKVDQVFIGSCTNGRIKDLEIVFNILKNKKLAKNLRLIITPASQKIWQQALNRNYLNFFNKLGAIITNPGCGACLGRHGGVLADSEVCVATSNRNFQGRMGSPRAKIYLASPATAAQSAIRGYI